MSAFNKHEAIYINPNSDQITHSVNLIQQKQLALNDRYE